MKMPELTRKVIEFIEANEGTHTYKEIASGVGTEPRAVISVKKAMVNYGRPDIAERVVTQFEKYPRGVAPVKLVNYEA